MTINITLLFCVAATLSATAQNHNKVFIQNNATLVTTGNVRITFRNMGLVNNGQITQNAGGSFLFTGSAHDTISGNTPLLLQELGIAKVNPAVLSLNCAITINSKVAFNSGNINLNGNNLLLTPDAFLENEQETSRIMSSSGGWVSIIKNLNAPVSENPGNLGAIITTTQNMGGTTIRRSHLSAISNSPSDPVVARQYEIEPLNNNNLNATLRLKYFDAELNGLTESNMTLWRSAVTPYSNFTNEGYSDLNPIANYMEKPMVNSLNYWIMAGGSNPLPVTFLNFTARCSAGNTLLEWEVNETADSNTFFIQRKSPYAISWDIIGSIKTNANQNFTGNYVFTDKDPLYETSLYRIQETGIDGSMFFSKTVAINCTPGFKNVIIYPNPTSGKIYIESATPLNILLFDLAGRQLREEKNTRIMDMQMLPPGMYIIRLSDEHNLYTKTEKITKY